MKIITLDFETDPFEHGVVVKPFACGIFDGQNFTSIWGQNCAETAVKLLKALKEPHVIYMHNGGRFDIYFLYRHLAPERLIIGGRIVQAKLGIHEVRDSYSILPIALKQYDKDDIDYRKMYADVRELHKKEILSYLRKDCTSLYELVSAFRDEFGDYLTIASAAMAQLKKRHDYERFDGAADSSIRRDFFYGGRVQCFTRAGIVKQQYGIYDVNSMYPHVMRNKLHPCGADYISKNPDDSKAAFIVATGKQLGKIGCFPVRTKTGLNFTTEYGTFSFTHHEWQTAMRHDAFRCDRVERVHCFDDRICFDEFVDHFYNARQRAKKENDKIHDIFYKLILNSAYGKFAQNPDKFRDWAVTPSDEVMPSPWSPYLIPANQRHPYTVWERPVARYTFYNVSIGASITGAARAELFDGLMRSEGILYCDTDSIIAAKVEVAKSDTELGAWKLEGQGDRFVAAGKKMYACFAGDKCIKRATKGSRLTDEEIVDVAIGRNIKYKKDAPTFKLNGSVQFIEREIRSTI